MTELHRIHAAPASGKGDPLYDNRNGRPHDCEVCIARAAPHDEEEGE